MIKVKEMLVMERRKKLKVKSKKEGNVDIRKRAYMFALNILLLTKKLPNNSFGWAISNQIIRSATSISSNLVEAKGASSRADFINFYHHSLKSANETTHWLCLIRDSKEIEDQDFKILIDECVEITKIIASIIIKLKQ